ncbi:hypothetical protein QEG98_10140 [Myxococcus sp. MxC21-1]|uniref:hypothetical protein n=1 Tax=Myxococcus sp. MxC21-1 TaxID=3041439 RepID=UPI00292E0E30|nr:hypothetical protein [Myxococcus sp. MxC21-1]WNZ64013.1 hypothetical protein QEG98_10140 [Myxococcus sp. MxC21-1]
MEVLEGAERERTRSIAAGFPEQLSLFPEFESRMLGFVDMSDVAAESFVAVLNEFRPQWIMDLRVVPFFDLGGTSRRGFFQLFQQLGIQYRDVSGRLGVTSRRDVKLNAEVAAQLMSEMMTREPERGLSGPVFVLLEEFRSVSVAAMTLPPLLQPRPKGGWVSRVFNAATLVDASSNG